MSPEDWAVRPDVLSAILVAAAVTFACRAGGYVIRRLMRLPPAVETLLRELPGPLFVAYVAPSVLAQGLAGLVATVATMLVQWRTRQLALSIPAGVVAIALARLAGL
ncbi:AzlD family protein [Roseomonas sp. BN140053]|uniref:AzlD family protein n=1 Tax=Roseomonas sp. BN140053 TaxID=3391898 RepID=UPI0039E9D3BA